MRFRVSGTLIFIAASFTVTCARASRSSTQGIPVPASALRSELSSSGCELISDPGERIATVALGDRINPANAPSPANESERLLFRQVYETLFRLDCHGKLQSGLASSWKLDTSGHSWLVTLREDAEFTDNTPLEAGDVVSSWTIANTGELRPEVRSLVEAVIAVDKRTLLITLKNHRMDEPTALAHTDLAIAKRIPGQSWPIGTRGTRVAINGETSPSNESMVTLIQTNNSVSTRFVIASGRDSRDLLDEGVDLLVSRDTNTLNYAATLPQFISVPLAWNRTYVLLSPGRPRTLPPLSAEARETLAHDAVRGEARGAMGPFWWDSPTDCLPAAQSHGPQTMGRVVFDAADSVARDLADRLVGLASASGPGTTAILDALLPDRSPRTYQRAAGLPSDALKMSLRRGDEGSYVLAIDSRSLEPCRDLQALVYAAGWLDPETIVPLVNTRMKAILRRGRSGMIEEWDGGFLLVDRGK